MINSLKNKTSLLQSKKIDHGFGSDQFSPSCPVAIESKNKNGLKGFFYYFFQNYCIAIKILQLTKLTEIQLKQSK